MLLECIAQNDHLSTFGQTVCPKIIRDVHLWGQKLQSTSTKATTQQPNFLMFVFHVCHPSYLYSSVMYCTTYCKFEIIHNSYINPLNSTWLLEVLCT